MARDPSFFVALWRPPTAVPARHSLSIERVAAGLSACQRKSLVAVRLVADRSGLLVYMVGGPVRDALLGAPVLDLDFSVVGDAVGFARELSVCLEGRVTAHARFGTATVSTGRGDNEQETGRIDLVTARRESYPLPGQLPEVAPGSIDDDLARRDFTINAMALPVSGPEGGLVDLHGGMDDLRAGVVRTLHPGSLIDDPTRMLRAVRYEQRFGFRLAEETLAQMAVAIAAAGMNDVSGDRWRHELERIFEEDNPVAPLRRAAEFGLLRGLHPAFGKLGVDAPEWERLDGIRRAKRRLGRDECLAALFSPLCLEEGMGVIDRLRLSGRQAAFARDTIAVRELEPEIRAAAGRPSQLVRLLSELDQRSIAAWAEVTDDPDVAGALRLYIRELRGVRPDLSGAALLEMGVAQGPMVGEVLDRLLDARLDGEVSSEGEERAMAMELLAKYTE